MAARIGKCTNYSHCGRAYRNEQITVEAGPFTCPECGQPLKERSGNGAGSGGGLGRWLPALLGVVALVVIAVPAALWMANKKKTPAPAPAPIVASSPPVEPTPTAPPPEPPATPGPTTGYNDTPAPTPIFPPTPTTPVNPPTEAGEREQVKQEVLKRIDAIPNISEALKSQLYTAVDRSRELTKMFTLQFDSGEQILTPGDEQKVRQLTQSAEFQKMMGNPSSVFVVLGYADKVGDQKKNLDISSKRAQSVLDTLRDKCGVQNQMHTVAMGGSAILDANRREKNRVVEVWAVVPP